MDKNDFRSARRLQVVNRDSTWYRIANVIAGVPTRVDMYDEIGFWGVSAQRFIKDLSKVDGDIELHINSPGGDVFDGLTIYNNLLQRQRNSTVSVVIDGLAASAASFIAQAASAGQLRIAKTASMMIHNGFGMVIGDADDMRQMADILEKQTANIASIYADRTGQPVEHWSALMAAESWFIGQEAVDAGLADELLDVDGMPMGNWDLSVFKNAPRKGSGPQNAAKGGSGLSGHGTYSGRHEHDHPAYDGMGNVHGHSHLHDGDADHGHEHSDEFASADPSQGGTSTGAGDGQAANRASHGKPAKQKVRHKPTTQTHSHDHGAFGSPDADDGIHMHMHRHDNDSSHEHDHADVPGTQQTTQVDPNETGGIVNPPGNLLDAIPGDKLPDWMRPGNAAYDDSDWDGGAAMKAAANADDPAAALNAICAGKREGDPAQRKSHALPHHKTPGGPPNRHGVDNALSRLPQTQGLTNADAAKAHLHAHQAAWAGGDDGSTGASNEWQEAAVRAGTQMAELLRGHQPVADAPQGGE